MVTEQYLIRLLKTHDREAISLLYDRYGAALYGVVLRIVGNEALAEDVMQDTFIKVWRKGASFDRRKGKLFTWLLNIARNTAIDTIRTSHYRRRDNTQPIDQSLQNNHHYSESMNIDQIGLQKEVNNLDEKYRVIIDLIYFSGYTQREVVEELGIPLGTVKTRLKIGLRELRKIYLNTTVSMVNLLTLGAMLAFFG